MSNFAGTPRPPRTLGPYELLGELARGGQGVVYKAHQPGIPRPLAIKVLLTPSPNHVARFTQEAQVLARLQHPNLPRVVDLGQHEGRPYMVMEFLEGEDLSDVLREKGPLDVEQAVGVLVTVAGTLQHCHAHGVVHRDLKPGNVVLEKGTGRPVLVDFGLLKRDPEGFGELSQDQRASLLTKTGETLGTPSYMAPEQVDPSFGVVGPPADVYALGATLYALLTGRAPFAGATPYNVILKVMDDPPPDPRAVRPEIPRALAEACLRAMSKDQAERPASAQAFAEALETAGSASASPRRWLLVLPAMLVLMTVAAVVAFATPSPSPSPSPASVDASPVDAAPADSPTGLGVDVEGQIREARRHLAARACLDGLVALADVPEPPSDLVWELNKLQVLRGLASGDAREALACLAEPASQRGLAGGGERLQRAREGLAREAIEGTLELVENTAIGLSLEGLARLTGLLRLARALLPHGTSLDAAELSPVSELISAQLGLVSREVLHAYADVGLAAAELAPRDANLLSVVVSMSFRPIGSEALRRLLPHARRLGEVSQRLKDRVLVAGLLLEIGERAEALEATETLLNAALDPPTRARLLELRAAVYERTQEWALALADLEDAVAIAPGDPDLRVGRVDALSAMGRDADALEGLCAIFTDFSWGNPGERVLQARPFRLTVNRLWAVGGRSKRPVVMRDALRRLVEGTAPADPALWWLRLAVMELETGNPPGARVALEAATTDIGLRGGGARLKGHLLRAKLALEAGGGEALADLERLLTRYETREHESR